MDEEIGTLFYRGGMSTHSAPVEAVSAGTSSLRRVLVPITWASVVTLLFGTLIAGTPTAPAASAALFVALGLSLSALVAATHRWVTGVPGMLACSLTVGLGGAVMTAVQPHGPGFVACFVALAMIGLTLPRRLMLVAGGAVVAAAIAGVVVAGDHPASSALNIALGAAFLLGASAYASVSRTASDRMAELVAEQRATQRAREESAVLEERSRVARDLHDVLAHTLSGLAVRLEATRLLAERDAADPLLIEQVAAAHRLATEGMVEARRAIQALRGDALPGPADLPRLVADARAAGVTAGLEIAGVERAIPPEAGMALFRVAQESLTNVAKHAGPGARALVRLRYADDEIELVVADVAGTARAAVMPSSGFGIRGMAERVALLGGALDAGPTDEGWTVRLVLPVTGEPAGTAGAAA